MESNDVFPGASTLVEGAFPRGVYLLMGPSGVGKTTFCKSFIAKGISNDEPGVYLSTDENCDRIRNSINQLTGRQESLNELKMIDAYSWRFSGVDYDEPYVRVDPSNFSEINIICDRVCEGLVHPRFVIDSISSLAFHSSPEITLKFLQIITAKLRRNDAMAFFTLIPMSHENRFLSAVKTLFDGILEMRIDETGWEISRMFRVFSIKGVSHRSQWVLFDIDELGMSLVDEDTPRCAWCGGVIEYEPHRSLIGERDYTFHAPACELKFRKKLAQ